MGNRSSTLPGGCRCPEEGSPDITHLQELQDLLTTHQEVLPSQYHKQCLQTSIIHGDVDQLKQVLRRRVNPNLKWKHCTADLRDYSEGTALLAAIFLGYEDKVIALLEHGADINMKNMYGESALHFAASSGNLSILQYLLQHGNGLKCLNDKSKRRLGHRDLRRYVHCTALHIAAIYAKAQCAETLLHHGAKMGDAAEVCCALANKEDNLELMRRILSTGYSINQHRGYRKNTLLHDAAMKGNPDIVSDLLARGAKVNALDRLKLTPLSLAISQQHTLVARTLITAGTDVNKADHSGWVPLHYAALNGNPGLITMLLEHGAKTDKREKSSFMMPHHECLMSSHAQCQSLQILLMHDCQMDAGSKVGSAMTLAYTIQNERKGPIHPCLSLLFSHGACDDDILVKLALVYQNGVDHSWLPALFQLIIHSGNDTADQIGILAAIEQWFFAVDHKYYRCLLECRREVQSLKEYTRIAIRRRFRDIRNGKSIWPCIDNSKLPKPLQYYLKLLDICGENLLHEINTMDQC